MITLSRKIGCNVRFNRDTKKTVIMGSCRQTLEQWCWCATCDMWYSLSGCYYKSSNLNLSSDVSNLMFKLNTIYKGGWSDNLTLLVRSRDPRCQHRSDTLASLAELTNIKLETLRTRRNQDALSTCQVVPPSTDPSPGLPSSPDRHNTCSCR